MKRLALVLLVALIAFPAFQSCKKGDNDPAISFKSRNARITAKWKLTKIEGSDVTTTASASSSTTTTFDGSVYKTTTTPGNIVYTATGTYDMTIEDHGNMSWNETYIDGTPPETDTRTSTGYWQWYDSDKSKSFVNLDGGNHLFHGGLFKIDRLATKELVLIDAGTSTHNETTESWSKTYTFEKQ